MIDGKRQSWSPIVKFCASNQEVVDLFTKDRLDALRLQRKLDPHGPRAWAVSVEPSDGGGHCQCPECLKLGSPSDRVFHVANQVARAVAREFPDGRVSLLAYNEHAAVPKIPLEKNVHVMVAPYAFQRTDLSPERLLEAWSRKVRGDERLRLLVDPRLEPGPADLRLLAQGARAAAALARPARGRLQCRIDVQRRRHGRCLVSARPARLGSRSSTNARCWTSSTSYRSDGARRPCSACSNAGRPASI